MLRIEKMAGKTTETAFYEIRESNFGHPCVSNSKHKPVVFDKLYMILTQYQKIRL